MGIGSLRLSFPRLLQALGNVLEINKVWGFLSLKKTHILLGGPFF